MKMKTGIQKLDEVLDGGLQEKTSILLLGAPKSGKTTFGMQFLFEGLKSSEYGLCIITNNFPENFVKDLNKFGEVEHILQNGLLRFVDCYSVHVGVPKESTVFIIRVNGPTALNEINIAVSEILKSIPSEKNVRLVLDSISTLLLYNNPNVVLEFVQVISGKCKTCKSNSLFIAEEGMHDEKYITSLNALLDTTIHLNQKEKRLEISGASAENKTLNYKIENGQIKCN